MIAGSFFDMGAAEGGTASSPVRLKSQSPPMTSTSAPTATTALFFMRSNEAKIRRGEPPEVRENNIHIALIDTEP